MWVPPRARPPLKPASHKFKTKFKEADGQLATARETKLKENAQHQELADLYKKERDEARVDADSTKKAFIDGKRYGAVKDACLKAGLKPEALQDLELLDLSEVEIETTSAGKVNVLRAEAFAENLKRLRPHWHGAGQAPTVNGNLPGVSQVDQITAVDLVKAEREAKKTGDKAAYHELHNRYQKQSRANR